VVKIFAFLELEQTFAFFKGLLLIQKKTKWYFSLCRNHANL